MSIFNTAYDTFACSGFLIGKTIDALEQAHINGMLRPSDLSPKVRILEEIPGVTGRIPAFTHPIYVDFPGDADKSFVVVDHRFFGKYDNKLYKFVVRNQNEADLSLNRGYLNAIWLFDNPNTLKSISPLSMTTYASWVGESVARRLALEPREQLNLTILAAYFYACLFIPEDSISEEDTNRLVMQISRNVRCSAEDVLAVIPEGQVIKGVKEFCEMTQEATKSIRLSSFNPALLYQILTGGWFGVNAKEVVGTAIEHPPTWMALVLASFFEKSYRNTNIAKLVERKAGKGVGEQYVKAVFSMIKAVNS